ncbi:Cystathionine beta-lyase PatB [Slackia heliotrinireducens]|uniref:cysteine-S-conjugate beta-lyase n=1 Tax=Slackia heliotrinireducens (strain ATCC 29202 / DSM 20476 / NCTC 11029 / RHS 1) TaxID=471855 RepID=C7N5E3_SLAHD|nr:aminotransferase class I/II-fold pyridoxal phosphate-dependent enzyme [Slackia heliotrinireducens]ACV22128.1 bifunctional PLP-dependent enzyme with beta-cystathionase and maltose regulon repressor activities [Slackia heliotrinireducens DSM 20476]VEH00159.1 Cystathionine beta-lyase PatB [Slackia heliotrinireducens]
MYDFDEVIDRQGTDALNTDGFRGYIFHAGPEKVFPYADDEFVRMWVADMEFGIAPEILDALRARIDRRIFGYTVVNDAEYYQLFRSWCLDHYDWDFPQEQLCYSPGIIPALFQLTESLVGPKEKVLMCTPAYGYFLHAAEYGHVEPVRCPLNIDEQGRFTVDYEALDSMCADPWVKLIYWCNPHNPSGRVWTQEELEKVARIIEKHGIWIVSDEIHCDILRQGKQHIPMGKVMQDYPKLITCMAPTKTFNMAGLSFSNIIIRDKTLRETFRNRDKLDGMYNAMAVTAAKAAYTYGEPWRRELLAYLDENFAFTKQFLENELPEAVMNISEATYLAWVDMSKCLPDVDDLPDFFANEAGVLLEGGNDLFVGNADGYIRLNLAMPRSIIKTGLERMRDAIVAHSAEQ